MLSIPAPSAIGFVVRFAVIVEGLLGALGVRADKERSLAPLMHLAWVGLERLCGQLARLAAAFRAGRLPYRRTGPRVRIKPARRRRGKRWRYESEDPPIPDRLPARFGWLIEAAPETAAFVDQVQQWLEEPELAALVAEAPQADRLVGSLCRMLGIRLKPMEAPAPSPQDAASSTNPIDAEWAALCDLPPPDSPFWSPENHPPMIMPPMIMPAAMLWPPDEAEDDPPLNFFEPA
ncbi:MAG: hypothetical protein JOZ58_25700 [Acetobacteraceae bacterium]|nr:hypothetical protein [Acetobacteraceae bacterium]